MVLFLSALILDFSTLCNGRNLAIKGKASKHARQDWTDADDDLYSESMQSDSSTEDTTGSEDTTSNEDTTTDEDGIRAEVEEDMQEEKSAVSEEEDTKGTKDDKQVQGENTSEESKKRTQKTVMKPPVSRRHKVLRRLTMKQWSRNQRVLKLEMNKRQNSR